MNAELENDVHSGKLSGARVFMVWLAANLVVTTLLTGTLFVPGVSWPDALLMIALGTVIGGAVLVLVGNMGTRTGLSTIALSKASFGLRGATVPAVANIIILMGWSWVQAMLAGVTLNFLVDLWWGYSNPVLFSMLCQLIVVCLAYSGHEGIAKIEPFLAAGILAGMAFVYYAVFSVYSPRELANTATFSSPEMSSQVVLDIVIATAVSWTVLAADLCRHARSERAGVVGCSLGYLLSTVITMSLGATVFAYLLLSGESAKPFDPTAMVAAFGVPAGLVIVFSVMATNTMVIYGMISSAQAVLPGKAGGKLITTLLGLVSVAGASWLAMLDMFTGFLSILSALFVPVFAIMLADYYVVRRRSYDRDILLPEGGKYWYHSGINYWALALWLMGIALSLSLTWIWPLSVGVTVPVFLFTFMAYLTYAFFAGRFNEPVSQSAHLSKPAVVA